MGVDNRLGAIERQSIVESRSVEPSFYKDGIPFFNELPVTPEKDPPGSTTNVVS